MEKTPIPIQWDKFCHKGPVAVEKQRESVRQCLGTDGIVRGYYSEIPLDPTLPHTHPLYPSHAHTTWPKDHDKMVVDARIINDMKGILSEDEFWKMIGHLYSVGKKKRKIPPQIEPIANNWKPDRSY